MYEELTCFVTKLQGSGYGRWFVDHEGDGSPEHPFQLPFVAYDRVMYDFVDAVNCFIGNHKAMELILYRDIIESANISWDMDAMSNADVSDLDGKTVMALIVGSIRADRLCEGALLHFCNNGSVVKWLLRLKEIDSGMTDINQADDKEGTYHKS